MTQECKSTDPGAVRPIVNPARCEGKGDCIEVCPYNVFEVARMPDEVYASMGWIGKLSARVHGMKFALTPNADQCLACGLCVRACPERAIRLRRHGPV